MSDFDNWDFYSAWVDDKPAYAFVDLNRVKDPPRTRYPHVAIVRLYLLHPSDVGLSTDEEFDTLLAIEDALENALGADETSVYVGRVTADGCRIFFFYTSAPEQVAEQVNAVMSAFSSYRHDARTRPDATWDLYLNFLYPTPKQRESIKNRRVLEALQENEDPLTESREIDHWAYFPTADTRDRFVRKALELGFTLRQVSQNEDAAPNRQFGAQMYRMDVPSYDNIDNVTLQLFDAATEAGGKYDGWESPAVSARS